MGIYHGGHDGADTGFCHWFLPVHDETESAGYILAADHPGYYYSGGRILYETVHGALSPELVEAARIDGCGEIRIFNTIVVPLMKPAIATQAIFQFVASWNNLFMPTLIISSSEKKTLTMFVQMLTSESFRTDYGVVFLGLSITILPMLVMYFLLSRFIVEGVSLGGVKG